MNNIIIMLKTKKNKKKVLLKAVREQNILLAYRIFYHTSIFCSLENSVMNKKHSLSTPQFCSAPKPLKKFSRVSFPASKITPISDLKRTSPILLIQL